MTSPPLEVPPLFQRSCVIFTALANEEGRIAQETRWLLQLLLSGVDYKKKLWGPRLEQHLLSYAATAAEEGRRQESQALKELLNLRRTISSLEKSSSSESKRSKDEEKEEQDDAPSVDVDPSSPTASVSTSASSSSSPGSSSARRKRHAADLEEDDLQLNGGEEEFTAWLRKQARLDAVNLADSVRFPRMRGIGLRTDGPPCTAYDNSLTQSELKAVLRGLYTRRQALLLRSLAVNRSVIAQLSIQSTS